MTTRDGQALGRAWAGHLAKTRDWTGHGGANTGGQLVRWTEREGKTIPTGERVDTVSLLEDKESPEPSRT